MSGHLLSEFLGINEAVVRVEVTAVRGSAPRDAGTEMFVAATSTFGTIGGGRLEYDVVSAARKLLASDDRTAELDIVLGPEIGQCCGGRVSVSLYVMNDAEHADALQQVESEAQARPHVYLMGGGHVGRALADQFQHLPFRVVLVDQREAELAKCSADVEKRLSALPESVIGSAPPGSAFVVATHDHALDFLLAGAALQRGDAAYIGLIGSATKRAKFETWARDNCDAENIQVLVCPIGNFASHDKRPEIIAASVVAEVVEALSERHLSSV